MLKIGQLLTLYVIRDGQLDRRYLPELERLHKEGKFNHLCIVLNDSHIEKKKYGYGYGYSYGYGYKYEEYKQRNINNRDETKSGKIYPVYKQDLFQLLDNMGN